MSALVDPQIDTTIRKEQLIALHKNLNILLEREAKYGGSAPLDLLNQIDDHRQAIDLIEQCLAGHLTEAELDEALKPLLLALRNGQVVTISVPQVRWLQPIALFTMVTVMIVLIGVGFLIFRENLATGAEQFFSKPDQSALRKVKALGQDWFVTALNLQKENEKSTLWIGAESGSQYSLFYADTSLKEKTVPKQAIDNIKGRITGLAVDCKGNIWILVYGVGTQVYSPETDQINVLLNHDTTDNWLPWDTTDAIATRCLDDGTVEVWLGRTGTHTLQYQSDHPTLDAISFLSPEQENDLAFQASQGFSQIEALTYVAKKQTLWAADYFSKLLEMPLNDIGKPRNHLVNQEIHLFSLVTSPDEETIWSGADDYLIYVQDSQAKIIPLGGGETTHNYSAQVVGVNEQGVWFGGECSDEELTCTPLGFYNHLQVVPIDIGDHKKVNAIIADNDGAVWIGTDKGLLIYNE